MLKKLTLLAMAIGALVAFAAPAASADVWTVDEGDPVGTTTATATTIKGTGSISATFTNPANGAKIQLGPCEVHAKGAIWNDNGKAHGEITSLEITTPCDVYVNGVTTCTIVGASSAVSAEKPWTLSTEGTHLAIEGSNFTDQFNEGCPLGAGSGAAGTATLTMEPESNTLNLNTTEDHLVIPGPNIPVDLDGSVNITDTNGNKVTLTEAE